MANPLFDQMLQKAMLESKTPAVSEVAKPKDEVGGLAKGIFLGGAAADMGSTAYFLSHPELQMREGNPLINWAPTKAQLPIGAAMEAGTMWAGNKLLGNHPKLLKALMVGAGVAHAGFAAKSIKHIMDAQNRNKGQE